MTQVYLTQESTVNGKTYNGGAIYTFDEAATKQLIDTGAAEAVSLPTIDSIALEADILTDKYLTKRKELQTSARYDSNESERQHLLSELEAETSQAVADLEFNYQAELIASKTFAAQQALQPIGTYDEQLKGQAVASAIQTQLMIANSPREVVEMLRLTSATYDDATKIAILAILPSIKEAAGAVNATALRVIEKDLRKFTTATDNQRTIRHVEALATSKTRIASRYHQDKALGGGKR